jgi:hypothetical protein
MCAWVLLRLVARCRLPAFILGTVLSGQAIGRFGIIAVVWLNAGLLAAAAFAARIVPVLLPTPDVARPAMAKTMVQGSERCCGCRSIAASFWSQH